MKEIIPKFNTLLFILLCLIDNNEQKNVLTHQI